jgi:hypothetical protein
MNYRDALIYPGTDQTNGSGTLTIPLDVDKPISRIHIAFKCTKVLNYMTAGGPANIPKIELVDGSTVLHSTTGYENQALAYYSHPGIAMEEGLHIAGLADIDFYFIDFGRYLYDPLLAFDPTRFKNPQLKITYDENVADTSCSVNSLAVRADIFDEKVISPIGFLTAIEHHSYTQGTSGSYETISIPDDRVIRQILVRAYQDGYEPWYNMAEARFDEGTLDRIPWEYTDLEDYYERCRCWDPMILTPFKVYLSQDENRTYYIPQTHHWASVLTLSTGGFGGNKYENNAALKGGKAVLRTDGSREEIGIAQGYLPWHCFRFKMGEQQTIDDWYNPAGKKPRLRLRSYTGGTSSTAQVVLEELYRY